MERLKQQLQAEEIRFVENESLAAHCTFKIGGPADVFARPETEEQLCRVIALCKACDVKYYLLGNGSNILFEDAGYRGVVVDTTALKMGISFLENVSHPGAEPGAVYDAVIAGAGLKLSALCKAALDSSLTGLEFAYGIPGTVGGAVYMNAGAYGGEMKDVLVSVTYLTREGEILTEDAANLDLSYRHSIFEENGGCILSAKFHLKRGDSATIKARMDELMQKRVDKQPLDKPSAGSTFKRPVGAFAAALIDQCGLRGYRHGGAAVDGKLNDVLARVGVRRAGDEDQRLVNRARLLVIERAARKKPVRKLGHGFFGRQREDLVGKINAAVAGHAQNADAAAHKAGCDGGDGMCHRCHLRDESYWKTTSTPLSIRGLTSKTALSPSLQLTFVTSTTV